MRRERLELPSRIAEHLSESPLRSPEQAPLGPRTYYRPIPVGWASLPTPVFSESNETDTTRELQESLASCAILCPGGSDYFLLAQRYKVKTLHADDVKGSKDAASRATRALRPVQDPSRATGPQLVVWLGLVSTMVEALKHVSWFISRSEPGQVY